MPLPVVNADPMRRFVPLQGFPPWFVLRKLMASAHGLALFDQIIASGTNFLATILIARFAGASALGSYVIAMTVLVALFACQDAVIIKPYTIQRFRPVGTPAEHAGTALQLSMLLSAACAVGLAVLSAILFLMGAGAVPVLMSITLACAMPLVLTREFGRRFAFAHLKLHQAVAIDAGVAVLQTINLGALGWTGHLTAVAALSSLGAASGCMAIAWFLRMRHCFALNSGQLGIAARQSWTLGRWLLAGQITREIQQSIPYWLISIIAGPAATGVYAACMSVVSFANPLIFGLSNIITPKSVLAWKSGGGPGLWKQALRDSMLLGSVMAALCLVIFVAGDQIIGLLYPRGGFDGGANLTFLLALSILATALSMPASNALAAMERPRAIVAVGVAGAIASVVMVFLFLLQWGLIGAAWGFLLGNALGLVGRWVALVLLIPPAIDLAPAVAAARQLWPESNAAQITATRLGEGDFAAAYRVQLGENASDVVVKVYRSNPATSLDEAQQQFDALAALHRGLDGREAGGWTARVPKPLLLTHDPFAMVMSLVPGHDLAQARSPHGETEQDMVISAAHSVATLMQECWSNGQRHGDFGLRNLLFDGEQRVVSLIDPGTAISCGTCCGARCHGNPATADLGHHLTDLVTDVSDITGGSASRGKRQLFAETLLLHVLGEWPAADRPVLLAAIRASVETHLAEKLHPGLSPRGIWHLFIRQTANRRLLAIIERLAVAAATPGTRA